MTRRPHLVSSSSSPHPLVLVFLLTLPPSFAPFTSGWRFPPPHRVAPAPRPRPPLTKGRRRCPPRPRPHPHHRRSAVPTASCPLTMPSPNHRAPASSAAIPAQPSRLAAVLPASTAVSWLPHPPNPPSKLAGEQIPNPGPNPNAGEPPPLIPLRQGAGTGEPLSSSPAPSQTGARGPAHVVCSAPSVTRRVLNFAKIKGGVPKSSFCSSRP